MKFIVAIGAVLGVAVMSAALVFLLMLLKAYVVTDLYAWFIQPLGFPALNYRVILGILFLITAIKGPVNNTVKKEYQQETTFSRVFLIPVLGLLLVWFVGWLLHTYYIIF